MSYGDRKGMQVPMVVDTGADHCLFNPELAHKIGFNPLQSGLTTTTQGMRTEQVTAIHPVTIELPQLGLRLDIPDAGFTQLWPGWNGLLGNRGFMDRFQQVTFVPDRYFELVWLDD